MKTKPDLRKYYKNLRKQISEKRREEAARDLAQYAPNILADCHTVLSFASTQSEIDTGPLNAVLAAANRLVLPRVEGNALLLFQVDNLDHLAEGSFGIREPIPGKCRQVKRVDAALVPGLAFDQEGYRLGHGQGFYDRLLKSLDCPTFGLCFKEQIDPAPLPHERHDLPLDQVLSF